MGLGEYSARLATAEQIPPLPPDAQRLLGSLAIDVENRKPGLRSEVQGIQSEQNSLVVSIHMPGVSGVASALRLEIQFWVAQVNEIRRAPELHELAEYAVRARRAFDPAEMLRQVFSHLPRMADSLQTPVEQVTQANGYLVLKLRSLIYIPAITQMLSAAGPIPDGLDPAGPLAEYQMDVAEISTAPIPDSVFAVPSDYQAAPLEELVQAAIRAPVPIPTAAPKQ